MDGSSAPLPRQNLGEAHIAIADLIGRLGRTRTCNPQIRSLVLYPLSYEAARAQRRFRSIPSRAQDSLEVSPVADSWNLVSALGLGPRTY